MFIKGSYILSDLICNLKYRHCVPYTSQYANNLSKCLSRTIGFSFIQFFNRSGADLDLF